MRTQNNYILDYRVVIKPDKRLNSNKLCFIALCPTIGVADDGETVQEALENIRKAIVFHLKCLQEEKKEIPVDTLMSPSITLLINR